LQPLASSSLPALDGADRQAEMPRSLLVSATLQVAEDKRSAIVLGEPIDFFVDHRLEVCLSIILVNGQPPRVRLSVSPLVPAATDRRRTCT
jgi:hypothetical protein